MLMASSLVVTHCSAHAAEPHESPISNAFYAAITFIISRAVPIRATQIGVEQSDDQVARRHPRTILARPEAIELSL